MSDISAGNDEFEKKTLVDQLGEDFKNLQAGLQEYSLQRIFSSNGELPIIQRGWGGGGRRWEEMWLLITPTHFSELANLPARFS